MPEELFPALRQILRQAGDHAPQMREADLRREEASALEGEADAWRYPSVTASARLGGRLENRSDLSGTRSVFSPQAGVTLRQPLYQWGGLEARSRLGRLRTGLADANRAEIHRLLLLEIRAAFLHLAVHQAETVLAGKRMEAAAADLAFADERLAAGGITAEDHREAAWAFRQAELRLARLQAERALLIDGFRHLAGLDASGEDWVPSGIPVLAAPLPKPDHPVQPEESASVYLPSLEISRQRERQLEEELRIERASVRPRLDLVAGVLQDQVPAYDREDIDRTLLFAGIEVSWNLFDGFASQSRRLAMRKAGRLERERRENMDTRRSANLRHLSESLEWTRRELDLLEERLAASVARVDRLREDLREERIAPEELRGAEIARVEREAAATAKRAEFLLLLSEWVSEAGIDPFAQKPFIREP